MRLTAACLALAGCLYAQDAPVADWRFAHPSPTLVGGLHLKSLLDSPVVNAMIAESAKKDPGVAMMTGMLKTALGGVTEVRFSLLETGNDQLDALVMVSGKLDEALVTALSQGRTRARRIDENTILLGNGPSLEEAARRMSQPPALLGNRALMRGASLTGHHLWTAGELPEMPMTASLKAQLRGLALGISLSSDVALELAVEAADATGAQQLIALAREAEASQPQLGAKFEAEVENSTVHFRVRVPGEQVAQMIRDGIPVSRANVPANPQGTPQAAPQQAAPSARQDPPVPPPPQRKSIVIQGLEGGPKEIPVR